MSPTPAFWSKFKSYVLVDVNGGAWLTSLGLQTWGTALRAEGFDFRQGGSWQDFEACAAQVEPYAKTLVSDWQLFQGMAPGSPERELLAQLLGTPEYIHAKYPRTSVISLNTWVPRAAGSKP